jgi:CubicO group peptidase (beta-lactamase class C family)
MKRNSKQIVLGISITVIIFLGILPSQTLAYKYQKPNYWPDWDKWRVASPESQGMNSTIIEQMYDVIEANEINLHSVLIVRNGYIIHEEYLTDKTYVRREEKSYDWPDAEPSSDLIDGRLHHVWSVTKSFVSLLTGIAIDMGYLDLDTKFFDVFPDKWDDAYLDPNYGDAKKNITVEHLLQQNVGIHPWNDGDPFWWFSGLSINYYLSQSMAYLPGSESPVDWTYSSANGDLLSVMIANKSGMTMEDFARKHLFKPLKIRDSEWSWMSTPSAYGTGDLEMKNQGGFGLFVTPEVMARIGLLCLNEGKWRGRQVVSEDWIVESTSSQLNPLYAFNYGYKWWVTPGKYYQAMGLNNQRIVVIPEYNIVAVFTANETGDSGPDAWLSPVHNRLVDTFITPAVLW